MFLSLRDLSVTDGSKVLQGDFSPLPLCPLSRLPTKKKILRPQLIAVGIPLSKGHPNPIKQTHYVKKDQLKVRSVHHSSRKCTWPTDKLTQNETFMMRTGYLFIECLLSCALWISRRIISPPPPVCMFVLLLECTPGVGCTYASLGFVKRRKPEWGLRKAGTVFLILCLLFLLRLPGQGDGELEHWQCICYIHCSIVKTLAMG